MTQCNVYLKSVLFSHATSVLTLETRHFQFKKLTYVVVGVIDFFFRNMVTGRLSALLSS